MQTLSEVRTEILRLKWHVAATRFRRALFRYVLSYKAGFNPEQPRDDEGRWVEAGEGKDDESGESGGNEQATEFSDARRSGPPIKFPSDIPEVRPETIQDVNRIAREVSRNPYLATYYIITIAESVGHWLNEKYWEIRADRDSPKSLEELQDAVSRLDRRGYDRHHIVEQTAAREQGFPESQINGRDNLVLIPRYKHEQINTWYQTANDDFGSKTPRLYLQGKSWSEHNRIGVDALQKFRVLKP